MAKITIEKKDCDTEYKVSEEFANKVQSFIFDEIDKKCKTVNATFRK